MTCKESRNGALGPGPLFEVHDRITARIGHWSAGEQHPYPSKHLDTERCKLVDPQQTSGNRKRKKTGANRDPQYGRL